MLLNNAVSCPFTAATAQLTRWEKLIFKFDLSLMQFQLWKKEKMKRK